MNIRLLTLATMILLFTGGAVAWVWATADTPPRSVGKGGQGLKGAYYLSSSHSYRIDDEGLPVPTKEPDATRVDSQVAFGRGKGFGGGLGAWAPEHVAQGHIGVIWKGYIRLPKAGTYYFATASDDASAVYLNQARVALNAFFGGFLFSEAFTYDDPAASKYYNKDPRAGYLVPVTVERPHIFPIEVRFATRNMGGPGFGIDLYWVTPDAAKDAQGKPIAQIVPTEALYVEPPEPVQPIAVRGANSTISSDFLYLPADGETYATLTIRLADKQGRPVSGKRVHVSGIVDYGQPDEIVQPEKLTDANGLTSAKARPGRGYKVNHNSKFFATDVTDLVDVAQVAHVRMEQLPISFLPTTYAPYYDNQKFLVSPLPLVVGRPVTIKVPLTNRSQFDAELTSTFLVNEFNIGAPSWTEIGKVEGIRLRPGESREVSISWTPQQAVGHVCFKIDLTGRYLPKTSEAGPAGWFRSLAGSPGQGTGAWAHWVRHAYAQPPKPTPTPIVESRQRNIGPARLHDWGLDKDYWKGVKERSEAVAAICSEVGKAAAKVGGVTAGLIKLGKIPERIIVGAGKQITTKGAVQITLLAGGLCGWATVIGGFGHWVASDPPDPAFQEVYTPYNYELPPPTRSEAVSETYAAALDALLRKQLEIVSLSTAVLVSLERYQGAKGAGDRAAVARQSAAYLDYTNQVARKFEEGAVLIENVVASSHAAGIGDAIVTAEQVRAAQQQLASTGFSDDSLAAFAWLGVSQEFLDEHILPLVLRADPNKAAGSFYAKLQELAAAYRWAGAGLAERGRVTYIVGNPHDREETVDLHIRRISIPQGWKLSVVDAPDPTRAAIPAEGKATKLVREVKAGEHYQLRLPPKAQIRVASAVTPGGELGQNTTTRWAVEGRIGNKLVGGIVHELYVPAILSDLQLSPVTPDGAPTSQTRAAGGTGQGAAWRRTLILSIGAGLLLVLAIAAVVLRSRKRT